MHCGSHSRLQPRPSSGPAQWALHKALSEQAALPVSVLSSPQLVLHTGLILIESKIWIISPQFKILSRLTLTRETGLLAFKALHVYSEGC